MPAERLPSGIGQGKADSTAALQGGSASGMRRDMHRDCTDRAASGVRTGTTVRQEIAVQGPVRADSGTRRIRARLPTEPEDWAVRGRSPAVACRVYATSAGPSGAPPLGDVAVARAVARDRGSP